MATLPKVEIKNARIEATHLGWEDHGFFIAQISMDYGGSGQGFQRILDKNRPEINVIGSILRVVGVDSWEQLKGKHCRVKIVDGFIRQIGNILDDKWAPEWDEPENAEPEVMEYEG